MAVWTTLNPSDTHDGTLSGGNLIYTVQGGLSQGFSRAINGYALGVANKFYFEVNGINGAGASFNEGTGIALLAATYANLDADAVDAMLLETDAFSAFRASLNGAQIYIRGVATQFDIASVAVDLGAKKFWSKQAVNPTFPSGIIWNNDTLTNQNPSTGVGGIDLSVFGTSLIFPVVKAQTNLQNTYTCNFGQSAFASTLPTGFTAGWPGTPTEYAQVSILG